MVEGWREVSHDPADEDLRRSGEAGRVVGGVERGVVVCHEEDREVVLDEGDLDGEVETPGKRFGCGWS